MKKGDIIEGKVEYTVFPDKGYVFAEGKKISVKGVLPGQEIRFRLKRNGAEKAEGELKEVLTKSPDETACPACPSFGLCGGCSLQTLPYEKQLSMKEEHIRKLLSPVIRSERCGFLPIIGSPKAYEYRNKMEFSFGDEYKDGPITLGLHKKHSMYDIVGAERCALVHEDVRKIVSAALSWAETTGLPFYHRVGGDGFFRHLLVRRAEKTGKILVDIVCTTQVEYRFDGFVDALRELSLQGEIVGILHTKNDSVADVIRDDGTEVLYGTDHFTEELLGLQFRISPFSFFQTNSLGAEELYRTARDFVGETKDKVIFDLYSGTGTIGQMLAPVAKKVIGIEIVEEAVVAARENAVRNGLTNCTFLAGDVLKMLDGITDRPDIIVLDPPRDGIHPKALTKIIDYGVDNLVYISCKPTSLARDLVPLQDAGYEVRAVRTVDMFPQTPHVETVVLLGRTGGAWGTGLMGQNEPEGVLE
ncbi:MAG: 23S rRNA (uracil(1939)-C(5))-methyltransferase RlmD [Lachnospiraceae bacterium]|nr:23S rRNA (uracil(1939)-C(5))-methyltransferase RlmD [Lachnospiraceae bacterium]